LGDLRRIDRGLENMKWNLMGNDEVKEKFKAELPKRRNGSITSKSFLTTRIMVIPRG